MQPRICGVSLRRMLFFVLGAGLGACAVTATSQTVMTPSEFDAQAQATAQSVLAQVRAWTSEARFEDDVEIVLAVSLSLEADYLTALVTQAAEIGARVVVRGVVLQPDDPDQVIKQPYFAVDRARQVAMKRRIREGWMRLAQVTATAVQNNPQAGIAVDPAVFSAYGIHAVPVFVVRERRTGCALAQDGQRPQSALAQDGQRPQSAALIVRGALTWDVALAKLHEQTLLVLRHEEKGRERASRVPALRGILARLEAAQTRLSRSPFGSRP